MIRTRVLLDSNVLLLHVIGRAMPAFVRHHKKLQPFDAEDAALLDEIVQNSAGAAATVNCWTEVSNQLCYGVPADLRSNLWVQLKIQIETLAEIHVASAIGVRDYAFFDLGLTDAGLLSALNTDTTLLTIDVPLFEQACARGLKVANFNHIREARGLV